MASKRVPGTYITNTLSSEPFKSFIPKPLPPVIGIARASQETNISVPTITAALIRLQELGIVREITSKRRDKLYSYGNYIQLLNEGTDPLR